jgi:Tfp pilus assembly protein PilN
MTSTLKGPRKPAPGKQAALRRSPAPGITAGLVLSRGNPPADGLIVGGEPRVHLLPPEVIGRKRARIVRRRLGMGLVAVILAVAVGLGLATLTMASAQSELTIAQAQTTSIISQQAKYSDVLKVKADAAAIQAAQKQATAQEISWQPFIKRFEATLPAGASITGITGSIDAPFEVAPQVTDPLQGPRVATVVATISMDQSTIAGWLNTLPALKGFVDATPNSITLGNNGQYVVAITVHINKDALANRFTKNAGANK